MRCERGLALFEQIGEILHRGGPGAVLKGELLEKLVEIELLEEILHHQIEDRFFDLLDRKPWKSRRVITCLSSLTRCLPFRKNSREVI